MYNTLWTQFETQSLALGILRKNLYPKYLVRGYAGHIGIYLPTSDRNNPTRVMTIEVLASDKKSNCGFFKKTDKEFLLVGGDAGYKVLESVKEYLPA